MQLYEALGSYFLRSLFSIFWCLKV